MTRYEHLEKDELIRLLKRRDADRQLGLVWERDEIEADAALNDDYVALELDAELSHGDAPRANLIIEGDNFDARRGLRMSHKDAFRPGCCCQPRGPAAGFGRSRLPAPRSSSTMGPDLPRAAGAAPPARHSDGHDPHWRKTRLLRACALGWE